MASLRDIRKRVKSVKSIKQITYAMKMVSAARIKRAQSAILSSRPFAVNMEGMISDLYTEMEGDEFKDSSAYSLFAERPMAPGAGLVLKCMEKGLLINCTNGNILRFVPPLIITEYDVDRALQILDEALGEQ